MSTNIVKGYRTYLLAAGKISALTTRIYYGNLPQSVTLPAIVLNLTANQSHRNLSGPEALARATIQVDCYASGSGSYAASVGLGEAVREVTELDSVTTWGTETVGHKTVSTSRDEQDKPIDGSDSFRNVRTLDVDVWHKQQIPST